MQEDAAAALNSKYNDAMSTATRSHTRQHDYTLNQLDLCAAASMNVAARDSGGVQTTGLSFSNPVYELSNPSAAGESGGAFDTLNQLSTDLMGASTSTSPPPPPPIANANPWPNVAFKVEHVLAPSCTLGNNRRFGSFRSGLDSRWRVAQTIYPYMVCIALAYCVTLSLYPGIESEIVSCRLMGWMPILLMFVFNTSDVIGKVNKYIYRLISKFQNLPTIPTTATDI